MQQVQMNLRPKILKELAHIISPILCLIFNKSLETGVVDWHIAHVSPIYKKGSRYSPENDRPISLACICCKILEHVVVGTIFFFFRKSTLCAGSPHN
jgi:hypothetical protein